ncbi:hypothetical protein PHLGIDRAFT_73792 [Phlebiopsis gigantea 11061_1 CR5-6]|uniref:Uncharacterized protein n=1 Tax=Phlebiopsis gigantea (strain 11061_1 CR5-6) TaxID=745531 RepID=A0A0C3NL37_PHLG1|nr:hypothetical protein PHLGIDRAFT_73792 [Phlebiopsis gigantea 11061_1 CR5-6]
MAQFKQHVGRTTFSRENKCIHYCIHPSTYTKDELARTNLLLTTFNETVTVAQEIGRQRLNHNAERTMKERAHLTPLHPCPHNHVALFQQSNNKAMNISTLQLSNGKTRKDWRKVLRRKYYSCSSTKHLGTACPSKRTICQWCYKVGHILAVCITCYLG